VFTIPGDKPFQPTIGSRVSELLFENFDRLTATLIRGEIENTINDYEPRVKLKRVTVEPNFDNNEFNVSIRYNIIGIDIPVQQLTFILEPTR